MKKLAGERRASKRSKPSTQHDVKAKDVVEAKVAIAQYQRVQRLLEGEAGLKNKFGDMISVERKGKSSDFPKAVVSVVDAIHAEGLEIPKLGKHAILQRAVQLLIHSQTCNRRDTNEEQMSKAEMADAHSSTSTHSPAGIEDHEIAAALPLMSDREIDELAEDIWENGLREDIVLYRGKILDGRNRYRACARVGVHPRCVNFPGDDPVAFVLAKNLLRRNLNANQRAAIAAELLPRFEMEAAERKRLLSGTRSNPDGTEQAEQVTEKVPGRAGEAREHAAKMTNVNARYVSDAKRILEQAPELHEQVKSGTLTLQKAKKILARQNPALPETREADRSEGEHEAEKTKADAGSKLPQQGENTALTVVVWDDNRNNNKPRKFYNRKSYPKIVLFHIWASGEFRLNRAGWCNYDTLLTLLTDERFEHEKSGVRLRLVTRLVSISVYGEVPPSDVFVDDLLKLPELLEQVERSWPNARKILFGIPARNGWEEHTRRKLEQESSER